LFDYHVDKILKKVANEIKSDMDKTMKESIEDAQGILIYLLDCLYQSYKIFSNNLTSSGLLNYIIPKCIIKYIKFFVNFVNKSIFNLK
jgi:hypothetical protein